MFICYKALARFIEILLILAQTDNDAVFWSMNDHLDDVLKTITVYTREEASVEETKVKQASVPNSLKNFLGLYKDVVKSVRDKNYESCEVLKTECEALISQGQKELKNFLHHYKELLSMKEVQTYSSKLEGKLSEFLSIGESLKQNINQFYAIATTLPVMREVLVRTTLDKTKLQEFSTIETHEMQSFVTAAAIYCAAHSILNLFHLVAQRRKHDFKFVTKILGDSAHLFLHSSFKVDKTSSITSEDTFAECIQTSNSLQNSIDELVTATAKASGVAPSESAATEMVVKSLLFLNNFISFALLVRDQDFLLGMQNKSKETVDMLTGLPEIDKSSKLSTNGSNVTEGTTAEGYLSLSEEYISDFYINSIVYSNVQFCLTCFHEYKEPLLQLLEEEKIDSENVIEISNKILTLSSQIEYEIENFEFARVIEELGQKIDVLFGYLQPLKKICFQFMSCANIATAVWPPEDSREELLKATGALAGQLESLKCSASEIVATQKAKVDMFKRQSAALEEEVKNVSELQIMLSNKRASHVTEIAEGCDEVSEIKEQLEAQTKRFGFQKKKPQDIMDESIEDIINLQMEESPGQKRRQVKGGTREALIEKLTHHHTLDPIFTEIFILTYTSFMKSEELMNLLIQRYQMTSLMKKDLLTPLLSDFNATVCLPVQLRTFNVLKVWLNESFEDFSENEALCEIFQNFVQNRMANDMKSAAEKLLKLFNQNRLYGPKRYSDRQTMVGQPKSILPPDISNFTLFDLDHLEVARQLTLIDKDLFRRIGPMEYTGLAWSKKHLQHKANNIIGMIARFNQVSYWVAFQIVNKKKLQERRAYIKYFIRVARRCFELNNFNSTISIISGLSNSSVSRMKRTWKTLNPKDIETYKELSALLEKNSKEYRNALHIATPPCIPYLGVHLQDLTFIEDGNEDNLDNNYINFSKRRLFAEVIRQLRFLQQADYQLVSVPHIQDFLKESGGAVSDDEMYKMSLEAEPREPK